MVDEKYSLNKFSDKRESIITKIDGNLKFPESMEGNKSKSIGELNCPLISFPIFPVAIDFLF